MSLNRYRLRHLARAGHRGAKLAARLLEQPDRLIGMILLGNNVVNLMAASLSTYLGYRLFGSVGAALAFIPLTLVVLIFAEVAPKTLAAKAPERIAFPAAHVYVPLLKISYPLVWIVNLLANGSLRLLRIRVSGKDRDSLSRAELRTVVHEASNLLGRSNREMLLNLLDLESIRVDEVMVPRNEIIGIDLDEDWDVIEDQIANAPHSRLPVYRESIDAVIGFVYLRKLVGRTTRDGLDRTILEHNIRPTYFIPEGTPLTRQLLNFQQEKQRIGLVVDEYGDIQGMVAVEDILEEIVGDLSTNRAASVQEIHPQNDGSVIVDGATSLRDLNRALGWELATDGPKTVNGLVLEYLEDIPEPGTTFLLHDHPVEIVQTKGNAVRTVKINTKRETRQAHSSAQATG